MIQPIIPDTSARALEWLGIAEGTFSNFFAPLPLVLTQYQPLLTRIDPKHIDAMIEASKETLQLAATEPALTSAPVGAASAAIEGSEVGRGAAFAAEAAPTGEAKPVTASTFVSIDDFAKLDLRIAKVLECGFVDGADKLLRFKLDAGELGERQIFSGIRAAYAEPEKLIGRHVVFIANLAPRKMRFGMSEGMILSAGSGGSELFLLDVDSGAQAGMPVK